MSVFYMDGEFVDSDKAVVPASDLAILRGYGVFDFLRTYGGKPFQLGAHLRRLESSADLIGLHSPLDIEEMMTIVMETIEHNAYDEANIRIILTGGDSPDNFMPQGDSRFMVMVTPLHPIDPAYYANGCEVVTMEIERYIPGAKSLNYIPGIIARRKALEINPKSLETLYKLDGLVIEGTTTNTFMYHDGTWSTPANRLLPGITRSQIIKLMDGIWQCEIRDIGEEEYKSAEEIIITASNKEILPVVKVDDSLIGDGTVGTQTRKLMDLWREMTREYAQGEVV